MQFPPSPAWSFCIKHYLFLKCSHNRALRLFSDGNTGMVFALCGQLKIQNNNNWQALPDAFVYGQVEHYHDIFAEAETELLIVVFQPYGYFSLSGMPAEELRSRIIDAYSIFGSTVGSMADALQSTGSYQESISVIESFFTSLCNDQRAGANQLKPIVNTIIQTKGQLTVNKIIGLTGYSERQLERLFQQAIGTSPNRYLQIVRLHHFLSLIRSGSRTESFTIAGLESGYYDQPHLIRNFKKMTGLTPTQYLSAAGTLAVNLVTVN